MERASGMTADDAALAGLCRRHGIRLLAPFGFARRDELGPDHAVPSHPEL